MKFAIVFLIGIHLSWTQNPQLDSLKRNLSEFSNLHDYVDKLNYLAYNIYPIDINQSLQYINKSYRIADSLKYQRGIADVNKIFGIYHVVKSNYDIALDYFQKSMNYYRSIDDESGVASLSNNIGYIYQMTSQLDKAIENYKQALSFFEIKENQTGIATTSSNIGLVMLEKGDFIQSRSYFERALRIYQEENLTSSVGYALLYIGTVYLEEGNVTKAQQYFIDAEEKLTISKSTSNLIRLYYMMGKLAFHQRETSDAEKYVQKSMNLALNQESKEYLAKNYELLSRIYELDHQIDKSLESYKKFKEISDQILNRSTLDRITSLDTYYRFEIERNALMKQVAFEKKFNLGLIVSSFLFITLIMVLLWLNKQKRKANLILKQQKENLQEAMSRIKQLEGLMPICASCKKIRKENSDPKIQENWLNVENFISAKTDAKFTHSICPECSKSMLDDLSR